VGDARALWKCPRCGHRFVTRNLWHSCTRVPLASHFSGKDPVVRELFTCFRALVRRCGPATCYAQKTRIVFQARARFAGAVTRKRRLEVSLWLKRPVKHRCLTRVDSFGGLGWGHTFRLEERADLDAELASLVREAYVLARVKPSLRRSGHDQSSWARVDS
jgi:hypothetical protein